MDRFLSSSIFRRSEESEDFEFERNGSLSIKKINGKKNENRRVPQNRGRRKETRFWPPPFSAYVPETVWLNVFRDWADFGAGDFHGAGYFLGNAVW